MSNLVKVADQNVRFVYTEITHPFVAGSSSKFPVRRKATVAYVYDDANQVVRFGVAECSPTDNFNRKIGRTVALNRLANSGKAVGYDTIGSTRYRDIAAYVHANIKSLSQAKPYGS